MFIAFNLYVLYNKYISSKFGHKKYIGMPLNYGYICLLMGFRI